MIFSLDVWQEIIAFYDDRDRDTLYPLATVSSLISSLALDQLWHRMSSLEPLGYVINASASSSDEKIIGIVHAGKSNWVLFSPLNRDIRLRVQIYLSRIRCFTFVQDVLSYRKESSFWRILSLCVDHNLPILPSLQTVEFGHIGIKVESVDVTLLIPILSPSIQKLIVRDGHKGSCINAATLLQLIKCRDCNLREIFFNAYFEPALAHAITTCFPQITNITLISDHNPPLPKSSISIADFLVSLPDLNYLQFDLRAFPLPDPRPTTAITHQKLNTIHLDGSPTDYREFFHSIRFPLLRYASAVICDPASVEWRSFFDGLAQCGPNLIDLQVGLEQFNHRNTKLRFDDTLPISTLPLDKLVLNKMVAEFSAEEVHYMLQKWTKLELFQLPSTHLDGSPPDADYYAILVANIAKHPSLKEVWMDIDFQSLVSPGPSEGLIQSPLNPRLRMLTLTGVANLPEGVVQVYTLARNLLRIFPCLHVNYCGSNKDVAKRFKEFRKLVDCLREERRHIART